MQSIPLGNSSAEDKLIWPYTSLGQYTAQSGYKFLAKENLNNPTTVGPNQDNGVWKLVQGLPVPNNVKNFLWRACRNAMPAKVSLRKWMILTFDIYDHCKENQKVSCMHCGTTLNQLRYGKLFLSSTFIVPTIFPTFQNSYYMHNGKEKFWRSQQCYYGKSGVVGIKSESKTLITRYHRLPERHSKHSRISAEQWRSHTHGWGGQGPPKILKNYFIVFILFTFLKMQHVKIEVGSSKF